MKNLLQNFIQAWQLPRWRWALLIAVVSDALGFGLLLLPPLQWTVDAVTALLLFAVLGFRWPILPVLAVEVVPAAQVFPAWTLVVLAMASTEKSSLTRPTA